RANQDAVDAARKAVIVSRLIGEAQVRAYLICKGGSFEMDEDWFAARITLENKGQSPAMDILIKAQVVGSVVNFTDGVPTFERIATGVIDGHCSVIEAAGVGEGLVFTSHTTFERSFYEKLLTRHEYFSIDCQIFWTDVFGIKQEITVFLSQGSRERQSLLPPFSDEQKQRRGELKAYNQRHDMSETNPS